MFGEKSSFLGYPFLFLLHGGRVSFSKDLRKRTLSLAEIAGFLPDYLSCSHQQQAQREYFVTISRGRCDSNLHQKCHLQVDQSRCEIMIDDEDFVLFGVLVWYEPLQGRFQVIMERSNSLNGPVCSLTRSV